MKRCLWIGPVTGWQCDKPLGHEGDHRPMPGVDEATQDNHDSVDTDALDTTKEV